MNVDENISKALTQYIAASGTTQKEFACQLGFCEATIVKWRRPGNGISDANWKTLYGYIKPFLPKNRLYVSGSGEEEYSSLNEKRNAVLVQIPVLKTDDLVKYNSVVGIEQFARSARLPRVDFTPKVAGVGGMFCYDLETASNGVPVGARLYVSSEAKPKNGSLILAVATNGVVTLGTFSATGTVFELIVDGKKMSGRLDSIRTLFSGFFPVISYEVICF